jgi:hypothetical protein
MLRIRDCSVEMFGERCEDGAAKPTAQVKQAEIEVTALRNIDGVVNCTSEGSRILGSGSCSRQWTAMKKIGSLLTNVEADPSYIQAELRCQIDKSTCRVQTRSKLRAEVDLRRRVVCFDSKEKLRIRKPLLDL